MATNLNTLLISIVVLLGLVILTQIGFFKHKEEKLNTIIKGLTAWMANQEKINSALSMAVMELDTTLVDNDIIPKSIVSEYVREVKTEIAEE